MANTPGQWVSIGPTSIDAFGTPAIGRIHEIAVDTRSPTTIYAGGPRCGIWKTADGGASWAPVGDSLPSLALAALAVDPSSPTRLYAVLAGVGVFRSDDAAISWTQVAGDLGSPDLFSVLLIDPRTPSTLYLTAGANGLHRSTDSGATWTRIKTGRVDDLAIDRANPAILYVAIGGDGVHKTDTGGSAWSKMSGLPLTGFDRVTVALCETVPTTLYVGLSGSPFRLFRSTDGVSLSLRYAAPSGLYNPWLGVDRANPDIVYLMSAKFLRSTDGGATFAAPSGDEHECQQFAVDPVAGNVIYVGRDNGLWRSADRGLTFSQIGAGIANVEFYDGALAATDSSLMLGGTQDNGTIKYDGTGTVWNEIKDGDGATVAFDPTDAQILYAMGQYADSIVRSADGGASFAPFATGLPGPSACANLQFLVHPHTPTTVLACCTSLWRITSAAASWAPVLTPAGGDSIVRAAVDPSTDLYYAGSGSGHLYAGPAGISWQQVFFHPAGAAFSDLRVDPDDPAVLYATFGGATGRVYRLLRSAVTAPAVSGADITGNLPLGLTVNTLAVDRMAPFSIFVGTNRGTYHGLSSDTGRSWAWTDYNNGLPPVSVNDLEIHPTTGVIRAVTHGRTAYETYSEWPIGTLASASGRITFLRVHDRGTGWGPASDFLDVEAVVMLDTMPGRGYGFELRADSEEGARHGMLDLLRDAFAANRRVTLDYLKTGLRNGRIIRVADLP